MNRWTIQQLPIQIFYERKMALNPYSPLVKKLNEAVHPLQETQKERRHKHQDEAEK